MELSIKINTICESFNQFFLFSKGQVAADALSRKIRAAELKHRWAGVYSLFRTLTGGTANIRMQPLHPLIASRVLFEGGVGFDSLCT